MVLIEQEFDDPEENPAVIKYFVGTAVMYSPFFGAAYVGSYLLDEPLDGYSVLFPISVSIGTIFYLILGLYFFSKFLKFYIEKDWVICFGLITLTFATVAYFYTVNAPGWAHIAAFMLVSFLLYHVKNLYERFSSSGIVAVIATSSILFFVRPTDLVILLLAPFLAKDFSTFIIVFKNILKEKKAIVVGILLALIPLVCQLGIYKLYSGDYFIWSYSKEGFDFLHPEIINVLFSYSKGFFVYTPVCFLALVGLIPLYKRDKYLFTGVILYLSFNIYIISSWWCWNYGYSYGPRVFIEHYPVFFLLLAILLDRYKRIRISVIAIVIFFMFLNLFQTYQAIRGILDPDFKTDKQGYWDVFIRLDKGYSGKFYRFPVDESKENILRNVGWFNDMERPDSSWLNPAVRSDEKSHSGRYSSKVNKNNNFSTGIRTPLSTVPYGKNVLVRACGWFLVPAKGSDSYFAISFVREGKSIGFNPFKLDGYTQNFGEWEFHVFEMYMPKFSQAVEKDPSAQVEFYYFNNSDINCYVDDLKIEFIEFKSMPRVLDLSWE
jgi:hypothetical protein